MNNLELTKVVLTKCGIRFHELVDGEWVYIMSFKDGDIKNHINVEGYGLVELKKSCQFSNYMEFHKGDIASY